MASTSIEWTASDDGTSGKTWNPVAGCEIVSAGCSNCYAMRMAKRLAAMGQKDYEGLTKTVNGNAVWTGEGRTRPDKLSEPLGWKKPCRVFVNSMSDLFHKDMPFEYLDRVFAVMALCPQHTFQVLTKRPERMREYLSAPLTRERIYEAARHVPGPISVHDMVDLCNRIVGHDRPNYLPNVWLGTSVEDSRVTHRIDELRQVPAAVRFLSLEPLIGPLEGLNLEGIHWVIVGGESGPGARPCDLGWIRSIVRQCKAAGVPCFVKQLGAKPFQWIHLDQDYTQPWPLKDKKGGNPQEWPTDLRVREFPEVTR